MTRFPKAMPAALFNADWNDALFIHFRVDPVVLQPLVPLELDVFDGHAYISLVAFTQANLRPTIGGKFAAWLSGPLATHPFLNVRTYVRRGEERGIFFLAEWIPNRLAVLIGPRLYGLPYHLGRLNYARNKKSGEMTRDVICPAGEFHCSAMVDPEAVYQTCTAQTEAAFLLERYTAFTCRNDILRRFRIRHEPWLQAEVDVRVERCDLLTRITDVAPCSAHFSRGAKDVLIGKPESL